MSVIVHRCPDCGHNDLEHPARPEGKNTCSYGWCSCRKPKAQVCESEPELIPAWRADTGEEIATVAEPGSVMTGAPPPTKLHDCDACRSLFAAVS